MTTYNTNIGFSNKGRYGIIKLDFLISNIILMLVVFSINKPAYLDIQTNISISFIINIVVVLSLFALLLLLIGGMFYLTTPSIIIIIIQIILIMSSILHADNLIDVAKVAGPTIVMIMLTDFTMQKIPRRFLSCCSILYLVLFFITYIQIILYPSGMYTRGTSSSTTGLWFMGYDNIYIMTLLPVSGMAIMNNYLGSPKKLTVRTLLLILLMVIIEFTVWSGAGIVATLVFLCLIVYCNRKTNYSSMAIVGFISFFVISLLITFYRVLDTFQFITVGLLKKSATMTGRTYIWDYAFNSFRNNWFIGVGETAQSIVGAFGLRFSHAHSLVLDILYKGGIVMMIAFVTLCIYTVKIAIRYRKSKFTGIILSVLIALLFEELANAWSNKVMFWIMFVMFPYIPKLDDIMNKSKEVD